MKIVYLYNILYIFENTQTLLDISASFEKNQLLLVYVCQAMHLNYFSLSIIGSIESTYNGIMFPVYALGPADLSFIGYYQNGRYRSTVLSISIPYRILQT